MNRFYIFFLNISCKFYGYFNLSNKRYTFELFGKKLKIRPQKEKSTIFIDFLLFIWIAYMTYLCPIRN
ncbi:hypothetical protein ACFP3I_11180 [Chryseobacterium arachidis]|uniref:hypothetical protein n=1 Tax=Chryseobacterium arachidis TaxID=1416778 RepID=UPI0036193070